MNLFDRLTLCTAAPQPLDTYRVMTVTSDWRPMMRVRARIPAGLEPASRDQATAFFELYMAAQIDHVQWGGRIESCGFDTEEFPGWYVEATLEPVYGYRSLTSMRPPTPPGR